jgi:hypothetical protein
VVSLESAPDGSFVVWFSDGWLEGRSPTGERRWSCHQRHGDAAPVVPTTDGPHCIRSEKPFSFVTVEIGDDTADLVARTAPNATPMWRITVPAKPRPITHDPLRAVVSLQVIRNPLGPGVLVLTPDGELSSVSPDGAVTRHPCEAWLHAQGRPTAVAAAGQSLVIGTDSGAVVLVEDALPCSG